MTWTMQDFDDEAQAMPALMSLKALLPEGLESVAPQIRRPLEREDYSAALAAANKAYSERGPEDRIAALTYIVLLVGRDLTSEAMGILRKAMTFHAHDVSMQLAQVEALMVGGNFEAAIELLEALQTVSTAEPRHWGFMGDMYLDLGREDDAVACYERAVEMGTRDVEMVFRLGHMQLERDAFERAADHFEYAARLAPQNVAVWETTADVLLELGEAERAIYAYERILKIDPYHMRAWLYLGLAYEEVEEFEQALQAFEKVTDLEPHNDFAWTQAGHMHMALGFPEEALQCYRRARKQSPENADALRGAVGAAFELGDMEAAEETARDAIARHPDHPDSHYSLGIVLIALRRAAEALEPLRHAVALEPDQAAYLASLALAELMLGQDDEAFGHIRQAVDLEVDSSNLLTFTEELLKRGSYDEALRFVEQFEPDDPSWLVVRPILRYVAWGFKHHRGRSAAATTADDDMSSDDTGTFRNELDASVEEFISRLRAEPQVIPVMWDFEELDRIASRLDAELRKTFTMMIGVIEGRKDLEKIAGRKPRT